MSLLPPEKKCAICGKSFICSDEWAYRRKDKVFCSWSCLRKQPEKKRKISSASNGPTKSWTLSDEQRKELMERIANGEQSKVLELEYNIAKSTVVYYRYKVKRCAPDAHL